MTRVGFAVVKTKAFLRSQRKRVMRPSVHFIRNSSSENHRDCFRFASARISSQSQVTVGISSAQETYFSQGVEFVGTKKSGIGILTTPFSDASSANSRFIKPKILRTSFKIGSLRPCACATRSNRIRFWPSRSVSKTSMTLLATAAYASLKAC